MTRATVENLATLKQHGYKVWTDNGRDWELHDSDGDSLMIGDHGCVAPTQWEAVAEGLRRIAQDAQAETRAQLRVGDYYVEHGRNDGVFPYYKLAICKDGYVWPDGSRRAKLTVRVMLPVPEQIEGDRGNISYPSTRIEDPDLAECLALALDRAATILREAREETHGSE